MMSKRWFLVLSNDGEQVILISQIHFQRTGKRYTSQFSFTLPHPWHRKLRSTRRPTSRFISLMNIDAKTLDMIKVYLIYNI